MEGAGVSARHELCAYERSSRELLWKDVMRPLDWEYKLTNKTILQVKSVDGFVGGDAVLGEVDVGDDGHGERRQLGAEEAVRVGQVEAGLVVERRDQAGRLQHEVADHVHQEAALVCADAWNKERYYITLTRNIHHWKIVES